MMTIADIDPESRGALQVLFRNFRQDCGDYKLIDTKWFDEGRVQSELFAAWLSALVRLGIQQGESLTKCD